MIESKGMVAASGRSTLVTQTLPCATWNIRQQNRVSQAIAGAALGFRGLTTGSCYTYPCKVATTHLRLRRETDLDGKNCRG